MNKFSIQNLCRTCLCENITMSKIQEAAVTVEDNTKSVAEILNTFSLIEMIDNFPDTICLSCIDKLADLYKFILQCENSTFLLKQCIELKAENCDLAFEKNVTENDTIEYSTSNDLPSNLPIKRENSNTRKKSQTKNIDQKDEETVSCSLCNKLFKNKYKLMLHSKCHQVKEEMYCANCGKKFVSKCRLSKHIKEAHSDITTENFDINTNICNICNKTFKSKYILTVHKKRHIHKGQFLCTTCGKGFNSKGCLNRHMRVHTGEKKYECQVCKKKFPSSNNLNLHSRIHSGVKPYLCTICGKSFTHPTGFTYHVRTHTNEKNYSCEFCGKAFAIQCHLDNHRKIHTGERPFPCSKCDKAFIKKVDLQRHEAVHSGVKPHVCNICDKEFLRPLHLNYHMMIHTEERPHKCSVCGKGFIRRYYLKDHMMKHHNLEKNLTCDSGVKESMHV